MLAFRAPNDQPDAGGGSVAERHQRAGRISLLEPGTMTLSSGGHNKHRQSRHGEPNGLLVSVLLSISDVLGESQIRSPAFALSS
jgi:hypothetical protein